MFSQPQGISEEGEVKVKGIYTLITGNMYVVFSTVC